MFFNLALFRAFHGTMLGAGANGGQQPPAVSAPPPAARTRITHVGGDPSHKVEDKWQLPGTSPLVTAFPFLKWVLAGAPQTASVSRSSLAGTLILIARRPEEAEWLKLDDAPMLSTEVDHAVAEIWAHEFDKVHGFNSVYESAGAWAKAVPALAALVSNPALIQLDEDSFASSVLWTARAGPAPLAFAARTTVGDLLRANDSLSDQSFMPLALSRAIILMGSKDNNTERNDDSSTVRIACERVTSIMGTILDSTAPSASSLAAKFPSVMADLHLPYMFRMHASSSLLALKELDFAHRYTNGSSSARDSIERELTPYVGEALPALLPILSRIDDAGQASVQLERLCSQLLPAGLSSSSVLVKFSELNTTLTKAAWAATITHAINTAPTLTGEELVTLLVNSQNELSGSTSGGGGLQDAPGDASTPASYGSVKEQVLGDALRSQESQTALEQASSQAGVDLVETLMLSGSVVLTRAMLLQEAWLHNKSSALGFCSLAAPSICPYFAANFTEDLDRGVVPDRLTAYVWPLTELATARTPRWSNLKLMDVALDIERLSTGTSYVKPAESDWYTVDSCLRLLRDIGSRFTFALGLSLQPQDGYSFTDGVDLQIKACKMARSLPALESKEWLTFLYHEFKLNWMDQGGEHYHAKLRSARPDHEDAQLSEYLPNSAIYMINVHARLRRAEPIADMRVAFPSLLASESVALPGTSGVSPGRGGGGGRGGGRGDDGRGRGRGRDGRGRGGKHKLGDGQGDGNAPGSKAGMAYIISPQEVFSCGTVFKVEDIAKHYKMSPPDQYCWPVLLSKKKGAAALSLCPEHGSHGGLKGKMHTRPNNFDLDYIYKHFTRKPTPDENTAAGWVPIKRGKN